jgi:hypothetical protein
MATSNSNNFNLVTNQIIDLAYERIGVKTDYRALTAAQQQRGKTLLNILIKSWIAKGARLWKTKQGTLFVQPNQASYIIDGLTADVTESYVSTTTTANILSGINIIPLLNVNGMIIGDFFGVLLSNGNIFWSTITNISGLNVTINNPLTDNVNLGAAVYVYTTKISRPENIDNAQCMQSNSELPMVKLSRDTYRAITIKNSSGIPNRFFYDKQLNNGTLYLWQTPSSALYLINFTFQQQLFDFDNPSNTADFPVEWLKPIYLNLAKELAGFNSISDPNFLTLLKEDADNSLADAEGYDRETTSIYFEPATEINTNTYR